MIGRADIEGSKSDVATNAWPPQASYPCGNFSDTSRPKLGGRKGSLGRALAAPSAADARGQAGFCPSAPRRVSVPPEPTLGHPRYLLTDVPPQSNSPPDAVPRLGSDPVAASGNGQAEPAPRKTEGRTPGSRDAKNPGRDPAPHERRRPRRLVLLGPLDAAGPTAPVLTERGEGAGRCPLDRVSEETAGVVVFQRRRGGRAPPHRATSIPRKKGRPPRSRAAAAQEGRQSNRPERRKPRRPLTRG
jgi:hypothetical protein